jgi:two-component system response regulator NreC
LPTRGTLIDMGGLRVLLADDHGIVRDGLRVLIDSETDMKVVAECGDASQVATLAKDNAADIVVVDLSMPGGGGSAAIAALRATGLSTRVLVLTMHENPAYVKAALAAGAAGYLAKRVAGGRLVEAIRAVARGGVYVDVPASEGTLPTSLIEPVAAPSSDPDPELAPRLRTLSRREREVLCLVAGGHTNQEAAQTLGISVKTIEGYRARIMKKLGAHTRADLVSFALRMGLLRS